MTHHILEYVVSGTSYMRLSNPQTVGDPKNIEMINELFATFVHNQKSHTFSALYNAYQESSFGERFQIYKGHLKSFHADSGGLQIVTQGKTITPELKNKIYTNQAKWADVGMCFDEIPVKLVGEKSDRNDVKGRWFDAENFDAQAIKTGENIKEQIEVFKQLNSNCKSFAILQGNDYDTYIQWITHILNTVPKEDHKWIGGIAMGAAALGTGPYEDVQRAFIASQVPLRNENGKLHLHILGVGSVRRLIPYLIFCQNGLYDDIEISYDSTTHSRAAETGLYYMGDGTVKYSREYSDYYPQFYDDISKTADVGVTLEDFFKILNMGSTAWKDSGGDFHSWLRVRMIFVLSSVRNFMDHVERLKNDQEALLHFAKTKRLEHQFRNLYNVKSLDDFRYWAGNQYLGGSMKSMSVRADAPPTLEGLFD